MKTHFLNEQFFQKFRENPQQAFKDFGIEFADNDLEFMNNAKKAKNFDEFQNFFMKSRFSNFFEL